jgi:hypothetical protein
VLRVSTRICLIVAVVALLGFAAGCGSKPTQDTKASQVKMGIVNMQQAVRAHQKYASLERLQQEYTGLAQQVSREAAALPAPLDSAAGLSAAADQEFKAKMAAREQELTVRLNAEAAEAQKGLAAELEAYVSEVDKEYQPQIFSVQLKLKTVQVNKDEMAALQADLERLQKERAAKITVRQQELARKMDGIMAAKQDAARRELDDYGQRLNAELGGKLAAQQQELAGRAPVAASGGARTEKEQQLAFKQQEITVLQDLILRDVQDKVAKVAAEKGLELVWSEVQVNLSAVDITAAVIDEIKK